ncbi:MAG: hypothetical protein LC800_08450 [Acidobacteria bacterium]|nr:hypothetical protein [Acidobacteriota bacterium]
MKLRRITRHPSLITLALALALAGAGCGARRTPDLVRIFERARSRPGKPPIVIVPGILGSQLRNPQTGEIVWPSGLRSDVDGLSLPMTPALRENRDALVADEIVLRARLLPKLERFSPEVAVYRELIRALKDYGGYREGSWDAPAPGDHQDTFYVFPYDWRRDNVETAALLVSARRTKARSRRSSRCSKATRSPRGCAGASASSTSSRARTPSPPRRSTNCSRTPARRASSTRT